MKSLLQAIAEAHRPDYWDHRPGYQPREPEPVRFGSNDLAAMRTAAKHLLSLADEIENHNHHLPAVLAEKVHVWWPHFSAMIDPLEDLEDQVDSL